MTVLSDDFFTIFDNHIHIIYFDIVDAAQWISIDDEHLGEEDDEERYINDELFDDEIGFPDEALIPKKEEW